MVYSTEPQTAIDDLRESGQQKIPDNRAGMITDSLIGALKKDYDEKAMRSEKIENKNSD